MVLPSFSWVHCFDAFGNVIAAACWGRNDGNGSCRRGGRRARRSRIISGVSGRLFGGGLIPLFLFVLNGSQSRTAGTTFAAMCDLFKIESAYSALVGIGTAPAI